MVGHVSIRSAAPFCRERSLPNGPSCATCKKEEGHLLSSIYESETGEDDALSGVENPKTICYMAGIAVARRVDGCINFQFVTFNAFVDFSTGSDFASNISILRMSTS